MKTKKKKKNQKQNKETKQRPVSRNDADSYVVVLIK